MVKPTPTRYLSHAPAGLVTVLILNTLLIGNQVQLVIEKRYSEKWPNYLFGMISIFDSIRLT